MPIIFQCSKCGKRFRVSDELAGRRARCKCGGEIAIPASAAEPQPKPDPPKPKPRPKQRPKAQPRVQPKTQAAAQAKPQPKARPHPQVKPQPKPQPAPQPEEELELEVLPEPESEPAASGLAALLEEDLTAGESLGPALPALPAQPLQQPAAPRYPPQYGPRPNYPPDSDGYERRSGSRRAALQGPREEDSKFYLRMLVSIGASLFGLIAGVLYANEFFKVLKAGKVLREMGFEGGGFLRMWAYVSPFLLMVGCFGLVAVGIAIMLRVPSAPQYGFLAGGTVMGVLFFNLVVILIAIMYVKIKLDIPGFPTEEYFEECVKALGISVVPGTVIWWCGSPMGQDLAR